MKNRNITIMLSVLVSFALSPQTQAVNPPLTPDPGPKPVSNTADGQNALLSITTGIHNTAIGFDSLLSNTDANFNTAVGSVTLLLNNGTENTATGAGALLSNTTGANNTANGAFALFNNAIGSSNTAVGDRALFSNTEADGNTATGFRALEDNTTGEANTATGNQALANNITGDSNTAIGQAALNVNTAGDGNTATGFGALAANQGDSNTANGAFALLNNTTGEFNTAVGTTAGFSLTTGDRNVCIGAGVVGVAGASNTIRIADNLPDTQGDSACFIGGIYNQLIDPASDTLVGIDANGKLGTAASSRRFKRDIKPMDKASEAILALKPVTFHYKSDGKNTPCFGLIAEEVAEVNPDLVVRNKNGEIWTVRYEQINAMLLNEFLKEHKKVATQEATIAELKSTVAQQRKGMEILTAQLREQAAQIQKVSAHVEMNRSATKVASLPAVASRPPVALREGGNNQ